MKKQIGELFDVKQKFVDLNVIECGWEQCAPVKFVEAVKKDFYTIHFVENGKGVIEFRGKKIPLRANDLFVTFPGELISYYPDPKEPWGYYWMCFEGLQADELVGWTGMTRQRPCLRKSPQVNLKSYFASAIEAFEEKGQIVPECVGFLYVILGKLSDENNAEGLSLQQRYVKEALTYIHFNFQFDISVTDIAKNLRVSPNYLSSLFQSQMGISTKEAITRARMEAALKNLQRPELRIKDVAAAVGYADPLYFSKVFRAFYGKTPREVRQEQEKRTKSEKEGTEQAL